MSRFNEARLAYIHGFEDGWNRGNQGKPLSEGEELAALARKLYPSEVRSAMRPRILRSGFFESCLIDGIFHIRVRGGDGKWLPGLNDELGKQLKDLFAQPHELVDLVDATDMWSDLEAK